MSQVYDRKTGAYFTEKVMGNAWIRLAYSNGLGRFLTRGIFSKKILSQWFGKLQDTRWSTGKIPSFIREYEIDAKEYEQKAFTSFNEFFKRRFVPDARPFVTGDLFPAPAEGRYLVFEGASLERSVPIKNFDLKIGDLIQGSRYASLFEGATVFIARLCPVDYHRFHYVDSGTLLEQFYRGGPLHSVNPEALRQQRDILFTNDRQVSCLKTEHFSEVMMIEVGALFVGAIHQAPIPSGDFSRGDEKGWFEFGGSTVIILTQKDKVRADTDLVQRSQEGSETFIRLGESIGQKSSLRS